MKLIFCMQINIKLSYSLILLILMGIVRHAQITQNNKFAKSLISHKSSGELRMKDGGFLCKISIKVFSELMPSFLITHSVTSRCILVSFEWYGHHKNYTQKSSSNTFSIHISHKKIIYAVDVLHADKHESLFQIHTIIFNRVGQRCPNYPRKLPISL